MTALLADRIREACQSVQHIYRVVKSPEPLLWLKEDAGLWVLRVGDVASVSADSAFSRRMNIYLGGERRLNRAILATFGPSPIDGEHYPWAATVFDPAKLRHVRDEVEWLLAHCEAA